MSKIARALGVLAVAGTPFLLFSAPAAHATGGCSVDNASTSTSGSLSFDSNGNVSFTSSSLTCSYVSGGGVVDLSCQLAGGICQAKRADGSIGGTCVAYANTSCVAHFSTLPGDTITLTVYGGHGSVADEV